MDKDKDFFPLICLRSGVPYLRVHFCFIDKICLSLFGISNTEKEKTLTPDILT
jgi:hypothetical protein